MSIGSEVVSGVTLTTYTITEGNNTTVTYYDTSSGISEDVGQKVTNGSTGESSSSIMLKQSDGSFIQTETYLEKTGETDLISIYAQKLTGLVLPQDEEVIKKAGLCIMIGSRLKSTSGQNLNIAPMLRSIESHKRSLKGLCNSLFDRSPGAALKHNLCRGIILE